MRDDMWKTVATEVSREDHLPACMASGAKQAARAEKASTPIAWRGREERQSGGHKKKKKGDMADGPFGLRLPVKILYYKLANKQLK